MAFGERIPVKTRREIEQMKVAARHVAEVLHAEVGARLRAGVVDGALGEAVVERLGSGEVQVRVCVERPSAPAPDTLLLAVPRPKVLLRMLSHAAALGFGRIVLFRSWRVDKSWLQSRAFDAAAPDADTRRATSTHQRG